MEDEKIGTCSMHRKIRNTRFQPESLRTAKDVGGVVHPTTSGQNSLAGSYEDGNEL
jgi:hypothetical protein